MKNFIITGSQRSGTTLLKLILNQHSKIKVIDEDEVGTRGEKIGDYNSDKNIFGFKLPMVTNDIEFLKSENLKLVHIIREPRDVIKSMLELPIIYNFHYDINQKYSKFKMSNRNLINYIKLKLKFDINIPWAIHPSCIDPEFRLLTRNQIDMTQSEIDFINTHPLLRDNRKAISICSKIWNNKNEIVDIFEEENLPHVIIRYEDLLINPQVTIKTILNFLEINEDNNLLNYYKYNSGKSIGNTRNDKPLNQNNYNKWHGFYNKNELQSIRLICNNIATKFGYKL